MSFHNTYLSKIYADVETRDPDQKEFLQAVHEVLESIEPVIEKRPDLVQDVYKRQI